MIPAALHKSSFVNLNTFHHSFAVSRSPFKSFVASPSPTTNHKIPQRLTSLTARPLSAVLPARIERARRASANLPCHLSLSSFSSRESMQREMPNSPTPTTITSASNNSASTSASTESFVRIRHPRSDLPARTERRRLPSFRTPSPSPTRQKLSLQGEGVLGSRGAEDGDEKKRKGGLEWESRMTEGDEKRQVHGQEGRGIQCSRCQ